VAALPSGAVPIDIKHRHEEYIVTGHTGKAIDNIQPSSPHRLARKIKQRKADVLFCDVKLLEDEERIRLLLSKPAIIDTATDGSHEPTTGKLTYGWVVAVNEQLIAQGQGPAEAHPDMSESFRAEAYGLASATAFLKLVVEHNRINPQNHRWFMHIDNKTLIKRMESYPGGPIPAKWNQLPDIDITNIAHNNVQGFNPQYMHVKSHQEPTKLKNYPARLNTMADELAAQQRTKMKGPKTTVSNKFVHLVIEQRYVTRDSQRWLMDSASRIPIQQYYQEKYRWSTKVFNEIAWDIQYKVLMSYDVNDQRRLMKYVHGWLPTNHRLHREQQTHTQRCPMCYYILEDERHLLLCKDPAQADTVKILCGKINDLPITPTIKDRIMAAIREEPNDHFTSKEKNLIQDKIGWNQILSGRITNDVVQNLKSKEGTNVGENESLARKLIKLIWDTILALWNQRNEFVYKVSHETKIQKQKKDLGKRVDRCYEYKDWMSSSDRAKVFQQTKEELMQQDVRNIKTWVTLTERIIRTNKREQRLEKGPRKMMENYINWHPPDRKKDKKKAKPEHHFKEDLKPD
jgi:hypothetical protein